MFEVIRQLGTDFYPIYILDSLKREATRTSDDLAKYTETRSHRVSSGRDESFRGRTRQETAVSA